MPKSGISHFKAEKRNVIIEFSILEIVYVPNFNLKRQFWFLDQVCPEVWILPKSFVKTVFIKVWHEEFFKKGVTYREGFTNFKLIITKCDKNLLQSMTGIIKWEKKFLQSPIGITKCGNCYKVRQNFGTAVSCEFWEIFITFFIEHLLGIIQKLHKQITFEH